MKAILFDVESHDRENPEIIEAAWALVEFGSPTRIPPRNEEIETAYQAGMLRTDIQGTPVCMRFKPSLPITLGAMATHHIMDEDLVNCDPSCTFELPPADFIIGHNVDFDAGAAGVMENGPKRIDTCALARHLWPSLDCYSQSALLYHLDRPNARERLKEAHSAAADILICKTILDAEIAEINRGEQPVNSWEELWQRSEIARVPTVMAFGKHKGMAIKDLPRDYCAWLLRATDPPIDPYLRQAITGKKPEARLL